MCAQCAACVQVWTAPCKAFCMVLCANAHGVPATELSRSAACAVLPRRLHRLLSLPDRDAYCCT
jgi:hypothetical protein